VKTIQTTILYNKYKPSLTLSLKHINKKIHIFYSLSHTADFYAISHTYTRELVQESKVMLSSQRRVKAPKEFGQ
jgi:hypothetical protein